MKFVILMLRRDNPTPEEVAAVKAALPDYGEYEFRRTDPADCVEHDQNCFVTERETRIQPIVFLPNEGPVPSLAMKRGVPHVVLGSDGKLMQLLPLKPEFKPFGL